MVMFHLTIRSLYGEVSSYHTECVIFTSTDKTKGGVLICVCTKDILTSI